jgi:hypothetical protein
MEMVYHPRRSCESIPKLQNHLGRFLPGVKFIFDVRGRVKTLDIRSNRSAAASMVSQLIPYGLPMLERFRVTLEEQGFRTMPEVILLPVGLFNDASTPASESPQAQMNSLLPRLKELSLSGTLTFWNFGAITNLTSLTVNCIPSRFRVRLHDFRDVLMQNANALEKLELQASIICHPSEFNPPSSIILPKLQQLHFGFVSQFEAIELLQALQVPSLKTLDLRNIPRIHSFQYRRLRSTPFRPIVPWRPPLTANEYYDCSTLLHYLCVVPSAFLAQIESLTLGSLCLVYHERAWYTDVLTRSVSAQFVCPIRLMQRMTSLKTLTLHDPDPSFLRSLNFPVPVPGTEADAQPSWTYPGPQLSNLMITHVKYKDLRDFLSDRIGAARHVALHPEVSEKLPVFQRLGMTILEEELGTFEQDLKAGMLDTSHLARSVRYGVVRR